MSETMTTSESLSVSSLEETVGLAGHFHFLTELLDHHALDAELKARWSAELAKIRVRQEGPSLCLAVVGEVASGKSTLINALIRKSLLPAHALPAPTGAAIVVRYGPQRRLLVEPLNGRCEPFGEDESFARLDELAHTAARVIIEDPAPWLEQGLSVVEIPGDLSGDRGDSRRDELARSAIRDLCDAALVTVPADIPVSETLIELLRSRLGDYHRCLFVVTRIDRVRPRERPRLLETIAGRLAAKLELASPLVVPVSAAAALGEPLPDGTDGSATDAAGEDYRELQAQFAAAAERLVEALEAQRTILLLERGAALVDAAFRHFAADLRIVEERARAARQAEEEASLRDVRSRIEAGRKWHSAALALRLDREVEAARGAIAAARQESLVRIQHLVARARGGEGLRGAIEEAGEVLRIMEEHIAPYLAAAGAHIEIVARQESAAFAAALPALPGPALPAAGGSSAVGKTSRHLEQLVRGGLTASASAIAARIRADQKKLITLLIAATFIGLVAGAFLFFMPLAVIVPGFVLLLSPHGERRRKVYGGLLQSMVENSFSRLEAVASVRLAEALGEARQQLEETADHYYALYDNLSQSRAAAEARAEEAARAERRARSNLDDLERRRQDLQQARLGLRQIQSL